MILSEQTPSNTICVNCGVPLDSRQFDESGLGPAPETGRRIILAQFLLPPQYCGVLEYFAQFTDTLAAAPGQIETPTLEWFVLINDRPLHPYVGFRHILNPWGFGSFQIHIRLDEGARLELGVRGVTPSSSLTAARPPKQVGGRITGRYYYNPAYGDPVRQRF